MNHNHQQSNDGKHDDDSALSDFLPSLLDYYTSTIPDELVEHYLAKSDFQCPDVRLHCKARQAAVVKDKRDKKKVDTLTAD